MNRKVLGLASSIVGVVLGGCGGGGTNYPDAQINTDAKKDTKPTDGGTEVLPPPMAGTGSHVLVPGNVQLIGSGPDSCTNQDPAPGDRWCGFTRPGTTLGFNDLWVINVTKAAAGVTIRCDTSDANCIRLSSGLYEDFSISFRLHGFDGDTLIYYEEPSHSAGGFVGNVRAWRPGWAGGRKLTDETGVVCAGHKKSAAALCFQNVADSAGGTVRNADLLAGVLTDPAGGVLAKVDTLLIGAMSDVDGVRKWNANISPDGKRVAWSTRTDVAGKEILKVQLIGDDQSRATVAEDVSEWTITADNAQWLWLRAFNYDQTGAPSGTLESAPFPAGTGPTMLAAGVGEFGEAGTKGILFRKNMKMDAGDLVIMPDRATPATVAMLDTQVLFIFDVAKDGSKAVYTKNAESIGTLVSAPIFDLYSAANDGKRPCTLAATPIGFLPPDFLATGDFAAWGRLNTVTGEVEGMYTALASCTTKKFATEIFSWTGIGGEGWVYEDELALDPNLNEATLRYAQLKDGALMPVPGTKVQTRAQFTYAPLLPAVAAVVYNVASGGSSDGLYINASLPFTTTAVVPPPDAGAPEVSTSTDGGTDTPAEASTGTDAPAETSPASDAAPGG